TVQLVNGTAIVTDPGVMDQRFYVATRCGVKTRVYGFEQIRIPQQPNFELTNPLYDWSTAETLNSVLPAGALTYLTLNGGALLAAADWQNYNVFLDVVEDPYDHNLDFLGTSWIVTY